MVSIWSWNTTPKPPSLEGPLRKIERADEHIQSLTTDISSFLDSCGYQVRSEFKGNPPSLYLTIEEVNFPPVPDQFSILAGEAIYHLRSALDHLVYQLVRVNKNEPTRKNAWPILGKENHGILERKIRGVSDIASEIIKSYQPYNLGTRYKEHLLWRLKNLNDWDKHNFVIRTFLAEPRGIVVEWMNRDGRVESLGISTDYKIEPGRVFTIGPGVGITPEMDVKVETEPYIVFEDVAGSQSESVIPILVQLSGEVANINQSFRSEFP